MIRKTIPFIAFAFLILAGASYWILKERESLEILTSEEKPLSISEADLTLYNISWDEVKEGEIEDSFTVFGKSTFDPKGHSFVFPPISGNVEDIFVKRGEHVEKGQILASILSKEAASYKMDYQKSMNEFELLKEIFESENTLYQKGFISEHEWLKKKNELESAHLNTKFYKDRLISLGLEEKEVMGELLPRYHLRAPIKGTVIEQDLILGSLVDTTAPSFFIADLDQTLIEIHLNEQDIKKVKVGTVIEVEGQKGKIVSILPSIDAKTLKTYALASLDTFDKDFIIGSLVPVKVISNKTQVPLCIKKEALVDSEGCRVVFLKKECGGFCPHEVQVGKEDDQYAEILGNLEKGDIIASENLFVLKSEINKEPED